MGHRQPRAFTFDHVVKLYAVYFCFHYCLLVILPTFIVERQTRFVVGNGEFQSNSLARAPLAANGACADNRLGQANLIGQSKPICVCLFESLHLNHSV